MSQSKILAVDLMTAASVPFLAIWLYEISNWIVLVMQGCSVSLSVSGWLPVGVTGVSSGSLSPLTKIFQIVVAVGVLLPLKVLFSKKGLVLAESLVVSAVGVYLASAYWESFFVLTMVPMVLHIGIFVAGASALTVVLLRLLIRPMQIRRQPAAINVRLLDANNESKPNLELAVIGQGSELARLGNHSP